MKKYSLLFFIFLSSISFSASNVYIDQDLTALRSDKIDNGANNIIKILSKDAELTLITMHYSGWSKVSLGDLTGWVLSDNITRKIPESLIKDNKNTNLDKIRSLQQELSVLKGKNDDLMTKSISIKDTYDKKITDLTLSLSKAKNQIYTDSKPKTTPNTVFSLRNNILLFVFGLISGFIVSFIIVRILRHKKNKRNIFSRSY